MISKQFIIYFRAAPSIINLRTPLLLLRPTSIHRVTGNQRNQLTGGLGRASTLSIIAQMEQERKQSGDPFFGR